MIRVALIVVFGALPATFLCGPALFAAVSGAVDLVHQPSWDVVLIWALGISGVWGAGSLWGIVLDVPIEKLWLGLIVGSLAALLVLLNLTLGSDDSTPPDLIKWMVSPVLVSIGLLLEFSISGKRKTKQMEDSSTR